MRDRLSITQKATGLIVGIYAVWSYYQFLGGVLLLIPFTYLLMPVWLFTAGIHAKGIVERGEANSFLKFVYAPLVVLVLAVDVVWNITLGSLIYRELPREWLFTTRTQRHYDELTIAYDQLSGLRKERAVYWAGVLNAIDPGHIKTTG